MHTVHELVPRSKDLAKLAEELDEQKYHEIEEFFVIQKRFYMGKEEPWKIWGTLSGPTKLEEWEQTMRPDPDAQSAGMQAPNMKAG